MGFLRGYCWTALGSVGSFLISFETDVPAGTGTSGPSFSHPGTPILSQIITAATPGVGLTPKSGTFTEAPVPGAPGLFIYNAELKVPYSEPITSPPNPAGDNVTWLKIVALANPNQPSSAFAWGWHDRDWSIPDPLASTPGTIIPATPGERIEGLLPSGAPVWNFQDDAVSGAVAITTDSTGTTPVSVLQSGYTPQNYVEGVDGPSGISQFSKDLAFQLYTIPFPSQPVSCC